MQTPFLSELSSRWMAIAGNIRCFRCIYIRCRYKNSKWSKEKFYIVDVPVPTIAGLPTCRKLKVSPLNSTHKKSMITSSDTPPEITPGT